MRLADTPLRNRTEDSRQRLLRQQPFAQKTCSGSDAVTVHRLRFYGTGAASPHCAYMFGKGINPS
jgi:hypothetical protein